MEQELRHSIRVMHRATLPAIAVLLVVSLFLAFRTPPSSSWYSTAVPLLTPPPISHARLDDTLNETLGFQKVFFLGLASRTDHRDAIELSAAATNISVDWIDGVREVDNRSLPVGDAQRFGKAAVGSWRAHMNTLNTIVKDKISSALILEDDADWDVRIKQQMHDFALSTRALTQLQTSDPSSYAKGTTSPMMFTNLRDSEESTHSPYGDDWDILWLGHCGMTRPGAAEDGSQGLPLSFVVQEHDKTAPEPRYIHDFRGRMDGYLAGTDFQNHTRLVHHPKNGFCSVAYAVSQRGARNLLWYAGVRSFDTWFDKQLPHFCEGKELQGLNRPICLTTQPQLFEQHVPAGDKAKDSDIYLENSGYREVGNTPVVRWSTRMNLARLLSGNQDYTDQYPDSV